MIIEVDLPTIVKSRSGHGPFELMPKAREALIALRNAGHQLVLTSDLCNRATREDWRRNPLWATQPRWLDHVSEERAYQDMLAFIGSELPGIFDVIDDGRQGRVVADMRIGHRVLQFGRGGVGWSHIAGLYGEPEED